ncbi:hypothetical protein DLM46_12465 [Paraburkholderia lacunae]|uniref:Uncharacterized protein n=1 Tax=Paraburkholderia lacunae TaxID=2211104 RepID=A0A370N9X1_9BURK|nr:hypothetical protein DLM46_12465 [Paraburkholderia lacunae]
MTALHVHSDIVRAAEFARTSATVQTPLRLCIQTAARTSLILDDTGAHRGSMPRRVMHPQQGSLTDEAGRMPECRDAPSDGQPRGLGRVSPLRVFRLRARLQIEA